MLYTFDIIIKKDGKDYSVHCPTLPGCFSNGRGWTAARRNMAQAIKLHVEGLLEHGAPVPQRKNLVRLERVIVSMPK